MKGFVCPVCGAPKTSFEDKEDAIKTSKDPKKLTDFEKKHIPVVTILKKCGLIPEGCQDVQVNEYISRVILTPEKLNPAAVLHLKVQSGKLAVIALCNQHGAWIKELTL